MGIKQMEGYAQEPALFLYLTNLKFEKNSRFADGRID